MIVVSDTTAISNLIQIGEIQLLEILFGEILLPQTVYKELLVLKEKGIEIENIIKKNPFQVIEVPKNSLYQELMIDLDDGEVEAITLAVLKKANYLLMDEVKGRKIASQKDIPIIGTLGILLEAKKRKLIGSVKDKMDDLRLIGFWINRNLYNKIIEIEKKL